MATAKMAGNCHRVLSVVVEKCCHHSSCLKKLVSIDVSKTFLQLFDVFHGSVDKSTKAAAQCGSATPDRDRSLDFYDVDDLDMTVFDILNVFPDVRTIKFRCVQLESVISTENVGTLNVKENAFDVMMKAARSSEETFQKVTKPFRFSNGPLTRKDELFNDLVSEFNQKRCLRLPKDMMDSSYIPQVVCNALWFITNHHMTINEASRKQPNVISVPTTFDSYVGYDDFKRKKQKCNQLSSVPLESHAQALYSVCIKPVMSYSDGFKTLCHDIKALADCLHEYSKYLDKKNDSMKSYQSRSCPARTVGSDSLVDHRCKATFGIHEKFQLLDREVLSAEIGEPVIFNEDLHLQQPFESSMQRFRFIEELQLSVPVDLLKYCPGGSYVTTIVVSKTEDNRTSAESQTQAVRLVDQIKDKLPEFHTRQQRRFFKDKLKNLACIQPGVADLIYRELTLDASVADHPETQQRLKLIFLGEKGLLQDLRKLNPGRPTGAFDDFFEKLGEVVNSVTAEDERRHNVAHLSRWISLKEMIDDAKKLCPENTPIPSKSLVRLQFTPRNPYLHSALNFTSRIQVQYKVQRRQLRAQHEDDHFCAAQFLYLKHKAIALREYGALICSDDKAKVPYGSPGVYVSTGVRGKKTIAPVTTILGALDHDMTSSSLTPSVYLECDVPQTPEKSFVRGDVTVIVNDSVFQTSSPFRHSAALAKILDGKYAKVLMKFTDGGTDQRNNLESVKCASICLFKELNLDMLILARCAPGHSWANPAERVMSILNLGLQNCALQRNASVDEETEKKLSRCNSMAALRTLAESDPDIKTKWNDVVTPVQSLVKDRFLRLSLKDKPFKAEEPISKPVITHLQHYLHDLFPTLDISKLRKEHTVKVKDYQVWLDKHCRQRHYNFQIRKCEDRTCCEEPTTPAELLTWLPDPVLQPGGQHYKSYDEVKNVDTTEKDRPSLKIPKKNPKPVRKSAKRKLPSEAKQDVTDESNVQDNGVQNLAPMVIISSDDQSTACPMTAQTARTTVECIECRKPRVVYGKCKLTERQQTHLVIILSESHYTCGSAITPPGHKLEKVVCINAALNCSVPVEISYYSSNLWRMDICSNCGDGQAESDPDLKKQYKTVLPMCKLCRDNRIVPVCQRPYGKAPPKTLVLH